MTDDPDFYAWLDGELPEPQASAMAARVAADPELAAFAGQHRALAGKLSGAFAPILDAPVPERLRQAAQPRSAEVVDLADVRTRRSRWTLAGLAAAASLALGLGIGFSLPRGGELYRSDGTGIAAAGSLDRALDRQLASAGEQDGIRMGLSFRNRQGRYCRSFTAGAQSGLACREGNGWAVDGLVRSGDGGGDYRMAAGQDPALTALIDRQLAGEPLGPEAEAAAAAGGWRN